VREQAVVNRAPASRRISALRASILHAFGCASLRAPLALVLSVFRRSMVKLDWRFLPRYLFDLVGWSEPRVDQLWTVHFR
jgi:hypothetical protein